MFLLNPGRYVIADPEIALNAATYKRLWQTDSRFDAHILPTPAGTILALSTGKCGDFATDIGKPISTASAQIAFMPCCAAEKLLPSTIIRINLSKPTLLFFNASSNIVLDGKLTIYCQAARSGCQSRH